ncbi:hypothetical protein LSH36_2240g00001 [Paralvinella palmiformis]|uniref:Uncharacterized protein n=1 Tax=Paralvinella palmiformis TaxID=53620 RepID=A0AAD9IQC5_9ANNE|nr:hypothetical protein LSH36_2240g00001 [Paralvinella palmiformis]
MPIWHTDDTNSLDTDNQYISAGIIRKGCASHHHSMAVTVIRNSFPSDTNKGFALPIICV